MSDTKRKIILKKLKKNDLDTVWHPESTLVFKSQKERLVTGRWIDEVFLPLDDETLGLCETWNFKPDESLMDSEEEDDVSIKTPEDEEDLSPKTHKNISEDEEDLSPKTPENIPEDDEDSSPKTPENIPEEDEDDSNHSTPVKESPKKSVKESLKKVDDLKPILDTFTGDLINLVSNLHQQIEILSTKLDVKTKDYSILDKKYENINSKFMTMKSLFN